MKYFLLYADAFFTIDTDLDENQDNYGSENEYMEDDDDENNSSQKKIQVDQQEHATIYKQIFNLLECRQFSLSIDNFLNFYKKNEESNQNQEYSYKLKEFILSLAYVSYFFVVKSKIKMHQSL
jgi:spore coat polysaccharide biosynthesis protein SpsF (cytidylyltransferase family)